MAPHDAAAMNAIFKAYDIRGVYPGEIDERLLHLLERWESLGG